MPCHKNFNQKKFLEKKKYTNSLFIHIMHNKNKNTILKIKKKMLLLCYY